MTVWLQQVTSKAGFHMKAAGMSKGSTRSTLFCVTSVHQRNHQTQTRTPNLQDRTQILEMYNDSIICVSKHQAHYEVEPPLHLE